MFESKFFNVLWLFFSFVIICPIFSTLKFHKNGLRGAGTVKIMRCITITSPLSACRPLYITAGGSWQWLLYHTHYHWKHHLFVLFCSAIGHRKGKPWSVGHVNAGFFFNTTWEARRGKILPDLEFCPWVLSFLLEFLAFPWDFWIFLNFYCHILINFDIFPLEFNFSKIFVNKNAIKSPTPSKILSFDRKIKFFSWIFLIGGKILPEVEFFPWVFGLSFFLEF